MYTTRFTFKLLLALLCGISIISTLVLADTSNVVLIKRSVANASVYVICVNLNDPDIRIDIGIASKGISHSESFASMTRRRSPIAAITGTYFDTKSLFPVGTIVVNGKLIYESHIGTAVCFLGESRVKFLNTAKGQSCDWTGVQCGLRTGPRLLNNGSFVLNPRREGFRHPGLFGSRTRMALGVTAKNKLLLTSVTTPVTFARLATVMKALGAVDAVSLDGGTSSAMYYRGKLVLRPGRALTNVIEVRKAPVISEPEKLIAKVDTRSFIFKVNNITGIKTPAEAWSASRRADRSTICLETGYDQFADLTDPKLRFTECFHSFFPVHRTQFACLKRLNYTQHFVHITTDA